jgi:hypothetical protein
MDAQFPMGTKLVKLRVPDPLHRRIKTVAASEDKNIPDYMIGVLEDHVPTQITLPKTDGIAPKKKPKGEKSTD